jgi:hypothetical protein
MSYKAQFMQLQVYNNTVTFASPSFLNKLIRLGIRQVTSDFTGPKNHEQELTLSTMQIREKFVETLLVPCV